MRQDRLGAAGGGGTGELMTSGVRDMSWLCLGDLWVSHVSLLSQEESVLAANLPRAPAGGAGNAPRESAYPWSRPTKPDQRQRQ